ncbi:MAG: biopolymer transporter ExbD [Myxococcota bacterium]
MGMSVGGSKGGPKSDINVTPLVDIVLVLLIIFLVLTPIKMRYLTLEVPRKLDDNEDTTLASRQITVLVRADNTIKVTEGSKEVILPGVFELTKTLRPMLEKKRTEKIVFVDFEDQVPYGDAVVAMDTVRGSGAEKVGLKMREEAPPGQ